MLTTIGFWISAIRNSQIVRLCVVGVLTLLSLIPVAMIGGLVTERSNRGREALADVSSKWGGAQTIVGPALVVPYTVRWTETGPAGQLARTETRHAVFLPKRMRAVGRIEAETRSRGIFKVPVYRLSLQVDGEFGPPNWADLAIDPASVIWERASLAVGISDVRAIREKSALDWNGRQSDFLPGTGSFPDATAGIHAPVALTASEKTFQFSFPLALNGSESLFVTPFAEETVVQLASNAASPNFQGSWLPTERSVSDSGFDATWRVSYLGRNYPQAWTGGADMKKAIETSRFGVELSTPVDHYRMSERSVKYAGLFILLTFGSVWLMEVLARVRVHPIQYLMLGAALCVFYLLELSISEHIRFSAAYGISSALIVAMVGAYSVIALGKGQRALVVAAGVAGLYGYLFVLLTDEDAALLVGSVGLFVILAAIMIATRRIDWYAGGGSSSNAPTIDQS